MNENRAGVMCEFFSSVCAREACVCFAALSASVSRCSHLHQSAKKALKALSYIVYIPIGAWTWWASGAAVVSGEHGKQMFRCLPHRCSVSLGAGDSGDQCLILFLRQFRSCFGVWLGVFSSSRKGTTIRE